MSATDWVILPAGMKVEDVPKVSAPCRIELQPGDTAITALGPLTGLSRFRAARMFAKVAFDLLINGRAQFAVSIKSEEVNPDG